MDFKMVTDVYKLDSLIDLQSESKQKHKNLLKLHSHKKKIYFPTKLLKSFPEKYQRYS